MHKIGLSVILPILLMASIQVFCLPVIEIEGPTRNLQTLQYQEQIFIFGKTTGPISINNTPLMNVTEGFQGNFFIIKWDSITQTSQVLHSIPYKRGSGINISDTKINGEMAILSGSYHGIQSYNGQKIGVRFQPTGFYMELNLVSGALNLITIDQSYSINKIAVQGEQLYGLVAEGYQSHFAKLNGNDFQPLVTHSQDSVFSDISATNNAIYLTGSKFKNGVFVHKYVDNQKQWEKVIGGLDNFCSSFAGEIITDGSNVFVLLNYCGRGTIDGVELPNSQYIDQLGLCKLKDNGDLVWFNRVYTGESYNGEDKFKSINFTQDSTSIVVSFQTSRDISFGPNTFEYSPNRSFISQYSLNGKLSDLYHLNNTLERPAVEHLSHSKNRIITLRKSQNLARLIDQEELPDQPFIPFETNAPLRPDKQISKVNESFFDLKEKLKIVTREEVSTNQYLLLSTRGSDGFGFGLTTTIELDADYSLVNINPGFGLYNSNRMDSLNASLGVTITGDHAKDWEAFTEDLQYHLGPISSDQIRWFSKQAWKEILIPLTNDEQQNIAQLISEYRENYETLSYSESLEPKLDFLKKSSDVVKEVLSVCGFVLTINPGYPATNTSIFNFHFGLSGSGFENSIFDLKSLFQIDQCELETNGEQDIKLPNEKRITVLSFEGNSSECKVNGVGTLTYLLNSERVQFHGAFENGLMSGLGAVIGSEGDTLESGIYQQGALMEGKRFTYKFGKVMSSEVIKNFASNGISLTYRSNGDKLKYRRNYINGLIEGEQVEFYPSGMMKQITNYTAGIAEDSSLFFFYDGIVKDSVQGVYRNMNFLVEDTLNAEFYTLEPFSRYGLGSLTKVITAPSYATLSHAHKHNNNEVLFTRTFEYKDSKVELNGENAVIYEKDGGFTVTQYGPNKNLFITSLTTLMGGASASVNYYAWTRKGSFVSYLPSGVMVRGNYNEDGEIIKEVTVEKSGETYSGLWENGEVSWEEEEVQKDNGILSQFWREIVEFVEFPEAKLISTLTHYGEEFCKAMCNLTGTKEGENCSCSGGGGVDDTGDPFLTDGSGNRVAKQPVESNIPIATEQEIEFYTEEFVDGTVRWITKSLMNDIFGSDMYSSEFPAYYVLPTNTGELRSCDSNGRHCGGFAVSRDGGLRIHKGEDYLSGIGEEVYAAIEGTVRIITQVYDENNKGLTGIEITNDKFTVKILYVKGTSGLKNGDYVNVGDQIGSTQDLSVKHPGVPNHVHLQIKDNKNNYFPLSGKYPSLKSLMK